MSEEKKSAELNEVATVAAVLGPGVTLKFDGEETATEKVYRVNTGIKLTAGQRVKLAAVDGTYIVLCAVGAPFIDYPIPRGGTIGQVLKKAGLTDFAVSWGAVEGLLPNGGTDGQVLTKSGSTNYVVAWGDAPRGLPSGGSAGQVLKKTGSADYAVSWGSVEGALPSGGTDGQVLTKSGSTNYVVAWRSPSASALVNGTRSLSLGSTGTLTPNSSGGIDLGSLSYPMGDLYANATVELGNSYNGSVKLGGASAKVGFFGTAPVARKTVAATATVATLITALKGYGLIS